MTELPCPPEHWLRFSALLDIALDVPEDARGAWLTDLRGEDATLRPWLARVLGSAAGIHTSQFLSPPRLELPSADGPPGALPQPAVSVWDGFAAGDRIGPYELASLLGEGGMGQVWQARRVDGGPQRDVALKVLQPELIGAAFRTRFRRERDVLAGLNHPHIAQLYEAAMADGEHPYLALELVHGLPITEYCRSTRAPLERRLELMEQVLAALSYAHGRLVVHRDIKPSNVLVTAEGGAKLLDFGIAKLLRADDPDSLPLTQPAAVLATPGYASPEQIRRDTVTVAADVFSAGVLLFEMLTGQRPFRAVPAEAHAPAAPLASHVADAGAAGAPDGATVSARWRRRLRGDLDAVLARALALETADRYATAEAFANDLRRVRMGRPVAARRVRWPARAIKFGRRHAVAVSLAGVLAVALVAGAGGVAWQARRAAHEAARANAIKDFLLGLFEQADPRGGRSLTSMTAKQLLDAGADRADAAFANQPATEMELLASLGTIYESLLDPPRSVKVRKRRLELAREVLGPGDASVVEDTIELSATLSLNKDFVGAAALLEGIRAPILSKYGPASHQRAEWLMAHAYTLRARRHGAALAEADDQAAIDILQQYFPGSNEYPHALEDLAGNQIEREEYAAAARNYETMRQAEIATHQNDAVEALQYGNDSASALEGMGQTKAAEATYETTQAQAEHLLGKDSAWYRYALIHRAELLHLRGERERADAVFASADALIIGRQNTSGYQGHAALNRLYGNALLREGRAADAIPRLEDALAASRARAPYASRLYRDEQSLGEAYAAVGRNSEARKLLSDARAGWIDEDGPASVHALAARERWARFLLSQGDSAGATAELRAMIDAAHSAPSAPAALAAADLAVLAATRGDAATADTQSARAVQWLDATSVEYDARDRIDVWLARAQALLAGGHAAQARDWAQRAMTAAASYDSRESPQYARAEAVLRQAK